ncbi:MAG TPA: 3-hydroxybutyrate dehydrogenase [Terriglobia bacterium]|nr:3-hydroxybutyrate dehydrogenase [Terriglobia bacterium]
MSENLKGKVAIITGAASGLGLAFSEALAAQGAKVVLADLNESAGNGAADKIAATGAACFFSKTDVSKSQEARALVEATMAKFGRLDILINNAGIQHLAPIHEFDETQWNRIISVMLTGTFLCTKYALPPMMAQKQGRIINISSIHGLVASEFKSAYTAAKHGIVGFTKVLALEGGPHNITAVAICPSYVRTPLVERQISEQAERHHIPESEVVQKIMLAPAALKRLLEPREVADLVVYLCASDAAQAITGSALTIDCGWTAR